MSANLTDAVCDNCDGDHLSPNCTQPHDEAKIVRNRAARVARSGGRGGRGGGRPYNGPGRGNGRGNSRGYQRGKFDPPKPTKMYEKLKAKSIVPARNAVGIGVTMPTLLVDTLLMWQTLMVALQP